MDREKVIKGLECCLTFDSPCGDCPYYSYEDIQELDCERNLRHDALALLKEQESVEPKKTAYQRVDHTIAYRYRCGTCDMSIFPSYKYCPFCGRSVNWDA